MLTARTAGQETERKRRNADSKNRRQTQRESAGSKTTASAAEDTAEQMDKAKSKAAGNWKPSGWKTNGAGSPEETDGSKQTQPGALDRAESVRAKRETG